MQVCSQPGKVWRLLWLQKAKKTPGSCRFISVQPLIGSTIREFSISSSLWVLEVMCCLYRQSLYQTGHSMLWRMVVGENGLTLCQECRRAMFWARYCSSSTPPSFFPFWKICRSVMSITPLWLLLGHLQSFELQQQSPYSAIDSSSP